MDRLESNAYSYSIRLYPKDGEKTRKREENPKWPCTSM
jgi:hypothetical protein